MQIGFNNSVEYLGMEFHIQTEDRGLRTSDIESHILQGGAIIDTKITSYKELLCDDPEAQSMAIKKRMATVHKALYRKLTSGAYNEQFGWGEKSGADAAPSDDGEFQPGQDRVPEAARLVEEGQTEHFAIPDHGEEVSLSDLSQGHFEAPVTSDSGGPPEKQASVARSVSSTDDIPIAFDSTRRAWRGCKEPTAELSISSLVEELLGA